MPPSYIITGKHTFHFACSAANLKNCLVCVNNKFTGDTPHCMFYVACYWLEMLIKKRCLLISTKMIY
jgi:heme/copper-type cytochrome/quinol oxidase subunit 3